MPAKLSAAKRLSVYAAAWNALAGLKQYRMVESADSHSFSRMARLSLQAQVGCRVRHQKVTGMVIVDAHMFVLQNIFIMPLQDCSIAS